LSFFEELQTFESQQILGDRSSEAEWYWAWANGITDRCCLRISTALRVAGVTLDRRLRIPTTRRGSSRGFSVLAAIFRDLLLALMEPLHYRRSPWYQRGLICEALPKVSVILLHDVEDRFLGKLSMVFGK
jgi:hypothetical protein